MMPQGYQQYQRTQTQTASPVELIVMMYGGAIKFLTVALQRIETGDTEAAHRSLVRAQEIVLELMISVDVSVGPIGQNLFDLYEFIHKHLVEANVKKDPQMVGDAIGLLRELLQAWEQAIAGEKQRASAMPRAVAVA